MKRHEARAAGLKRFHGAKCMQGHTERYTSTGQCCACTAGSVIRNRVTKQPIRREQMHGLMSAAAEPSKRVPPLTDFLDGR